MLDLLFEKMIRSGTKIHDAVQPSIYLAVMYVCRRAALRSTDSMLRDTRASV